MYSVEVVLKNETGLHARPASLFIKEAGKYKSEVKLFKEGREYSGKSILGILSMEAYKGDRIVIQADGEDEREAAESLKKLVDINFNE